MNLSKAKLLIILLSTIGMASAVSAATFTVNGTRDANDILPGDGLCETDVPAECTLRAAIQETNALVGPDAVHLPAGTYTLTLSGSDTTGGDLDITDDLEITGLGAETTIIDGGGIDRVFLIGTVPTPEPPVPPEPPTPVPAALSSPNANIVVNLSDLSVINGRTDGPFPFGPKNGGGIFSQYAAVMLSNVIVSNNTAGVDGGGIYNTFGSMTIVNSTLRDNEAKGAIGGGAVHNALAGELTVARSTIVNNKATSPVGGPGGGISSFQATSLTVVNSTICGNLAFSGGGISFADASPLIKSSTITGNIALGEGGAISGSLNLDITNTLISDNLPTNCVESSGLLTSLGNNLDSDGTCGLAGPDDLINVDPLLGPLQNNGGTTDTYELLSGSPAIDAGSASCTDGEGNPLLTDQRGAPRPMDGNNDGNIACDIGAFEVQPGVFTVATDIKPSSDKNPVNPKSKGKLKVAVITTDEFDASNVDAESVLFGPGEARPVWYRLDDVDYDRDLDLALKFETQETGITCGDTEATLIAETFGGQSVTGTDFVKTVGCKNARKQNNKGK